jgi:hypothetical protein
MIESFKKTPYNSRLKKCGFWEFGKLRVLTNFVLDESF